jgi:hypothetical protein
MTKARLAVIVAAATMALAIGNISAKADNVDFLCGLGASTACTGTVVHSGTDYSTTGIHVFNDSGPYNGTVPFNLVFDTAAKTISIDGTGIYTGQNLIGDITNFSASPGATTDLSFHADWPTLPPLVQTKLGTPTGMDSGFVIYLTNSGLAQSTDVLITPTPEPGSLLLLGSGLVGIGSFLRRKLTRA